MSALDIDERKNRTNVSQYAPPQFRARAGESTIRPVLERLSRGEPRDNSNSASAHAMPAEEPIHSGEVAASPKIPLSMIGRIAAAMGVVAAATFLFALFLKPSAAPSASTAPTTSATPTASAAPSVMPKKVHTVSFRQDATTVGRAPSSTAASEPAPSAARSDTPVSDRADAVATTPAQPPGESALALADPLQMWALFPDDPGAPAWDTSAEPAKIEDAKDAAPKPAARVPHHKAAAKHATRHKRRIASHRARRRRTRTAVAKPQPGQQAAEPAESQANAAEPIKKNPIQAALDKIFSTNGGGASDSAAPASAPAPTGAAFQ